MMLTNRCEEKIATIKEHAKSKLDAVSRRNNRAEGLGHAASPSGCSTRARFHSQMESALVYERQQAKLLAQSRDELQDKYSSRSRWVGCPVPSPPLLLSGTERCSGEETQQTAAA